MPRYPRVATGTLQSVVVLTLVLALLTIPLFAANKPAATQPTTVKMQQQMAQMPLVFAPNLGQANPDVRYLAHGAGYAIALGADGTRLSLGNAGELRLRFEGATAAKLDASDPQKTKFNYYLGNDRSKWRTNVPSYGRVNFHGLYAGIDATFYGINGRLEHDFIVNPGADASKIAIAIDGAKNLSIDGDGNLVMATSGQNVQMLKPVAYQQIAGERRLVAASYKLKKNKITFQLGAYDHSQALTIDPVVLYGTMVGGTYATSATQVAFDGTNLYIAGQTPGIVAASFGFSGTATTSGAGGGTDVFVAGIADSSNATAYSWVTFIGGLGTDDVIRTRFSHGALYLAGSTSSVTDFPNVNAYQASAGGNTESDGGFIVSLSTTGAVNYSTLVLDTSAAGTQIQLQGVDTDGTYIYAAGRTTGNQIDDGTLATCENGCTPIAGFNGFIIQLDTTQTLAAQRRRFSYFNSNNSDVYVPKDVVATNLNAAEVIVEGNGAGGAYNGCGAAPLGAGKVGLALFGLDFTVPLPNTCAAETAINNSLSASSGGGTITAAQLATVTVTGPTTYWAVAGSTTTANPFTGQTLGGTQDAFAALYTGAAAPSLTAQTLILGTTANKGANATDAGEGVAFDANGNIYVVGTTASSNLNVVGDGTGSTFGGTQDGFISTYDNTLALKFQRYVGKSGQTTALTSVAAGVTAGAGEFVGYFGGATDATHVASTATALQPDNGSGGSQSFAFKAAVNPTAAAFGGASAFGGATVTMALDGGNVYNVSGTNVGSFVIPLKITGDATNPIDYITVDGTNPIDGSAPATPLGLLTAAGCYNAAANTPGGVDCHLAQLAANGSVNSDLTFTPQLAAQCDEAHNPAGAPPCSSYGFSVNPNVSGAQAGAFLNGLNQNFTVLPYAHVTVAVTPPTSPLKLSNSASAVYTVTLTNDGNHNIPGTVTLAFTTIDANFAGSAPTFSAVASGTGAAPGSSNCTAYPTCTFSDLAKGTIETITITGKYPESTPTVNGSAFANVNIGADTTAAVGVSSLNNAFPTQITVERQATVSMTAGSAPASSQLGVAGQLFTFNLSSAAGSNVVPTTTVTFTLPTGFSATGLTAAGWTCQTSGPVQCTFANLAASASATFNLTGTFADAGTTPIGSQNVTATVALTDAINMATVPNQSATDTATVTRVIDATVAANPYPAGPITLGAATTYGTDLTVTVTPGTFNQVPQGALTINFALPTNFTPTGSITPPAGWSCTGFTSCTNTGAAITATGTVNFSVAGSYNDDPTNTPVVVQGGPFSTNVTFSAAVTSNSGTATVAATTTLDRVVNLAVTAPTGASPIQLGVATTLTTTLSSTQNSVPKGYAQVTFTPDAGFTVTSATPSDAANWSCTGNVCTNNVGTGTVTSGVTFTLHGSFNDDPTRNLTAAAVTGASTGLTGSVLPDTTDAGSTATVNGNTTLDRVLNATVSQNPAYTAGPVVLGTSVPATTYTTQVAVTVAAGVDNQVPQGALTVAFSVPTNFTTTGSITPPAGWTCTGVASCTNTGAAITATGNFTFAVTGSYNDDPTNNSGPGPVVQGGQFAAADSQPVPATFPNTTLTAVTSTTATTTLKRDVDISFTSALLTDSSGGTVALNVPLTYTDTITSGATSNTAPVGSLSVTYTVPADFNITGASITGGTNAAAWTCAAPAGTTVTCSNSAGVTPANGTAIVQLAGNYIDNPLNPLTPATINAAITLNTTLETNTTVGPVAAAATTNLERVVTYAFGAVTSPATAVLGAAVNYSVTMTSAASSNTTPINNATITYTAPADFNITGASITGGTSAASWTCAAPNNVAHTVACVNTAGTVPANGTVTVQLAGNYIDTPTDPLGTATVTSSVATGAAITTMNGGAPVTGTTTLLRNVSLTAAATSSIPSPYITQSFTYTYTVSNAGPDQTASPALDPNAVVVAVTVPADFVVSSTTNAGWTCGQVGQVVTCNASGTNVIAAAGGTSAFNIVGSYKDSALFATTNTNQTLTATLSVATPNACPVATAPCEVNLTAATLIPNITLPIQREVALTTTLFQKDLVTGSTTQVGVTDAFHYYVTVSNSGPDDATAPTVTGTTTVTIPVDANFTAQTATLESAVVNPLSNALDTMVCNIPPTGVGTAPGKTVVCVFNNLIHGATEAIDIQGTYGTAAVLATGSATTTTTASATDSLAVVTNAGSTNSTISTLTMDTPLNGGLAITPYFNFAPTLTAKYPLVTTSGITTDAAGTFTANVNKTDTYTTGALAVVYPAGLARTYSAPVASHAFATSNGLAGTMPDLCATFAGASFKKPERVRIASSKSNTDLTNVSAACAYSTAGQVHGQLSDWTSGAAYASNLSFVEPVNRNPVVLSQAQAVTATGLVQSGNTVTIDASKVFGDPDINQLCNGSTTVTCDDVLTIKIAFTNATLITPGASTGTTVIAVGSVTETGFPGNGPLATSMAGIISQFVFNTPANSTATFTLTVTDQVAGTATATYTIVNGSGTGGSNPPPTTQKVSAGGTAVYDYLGTPNTPASTSCTLDTTAADYAAFNAAQSPVTSYSVPSSSTLAAANISCSISGATVVLVTSGQIIGANHPAPLPNEQSGHDQALLAAVYALGGLPIFGVLLLRSKNRKAVRMVVLGWILVAAVLMMVGCGGGGFQPSPQTHIGTATTPSGLYIIQVTGTPSGTAGATQKFNLIVN